MIIILRLMSLVVNFALCQEDIEAQQQSFTKVDYLVKVVEVHDSEFDSKYIKFKILKVNNNINLSYISLKGFMFIKQELLYKLLETSDFSRLEGVSLFVTGNFSKVKTPSNPGAKSRLPIYLAQRSLGHFDVDRVDLYRVKGTLYRKYDMIIKHFLLDQRDSFRFVIKRQIKKLYQGETIGLLEAMFLGEKENIDYQVLSDFQKTGLSHIIAISGLHIGMLYLLLDKLICVVTKNSKYKFFLLFTGLILYNYILGHNISAIRATMMILVYVFAISFDKGYNKERSLYFSLVTYLLVFPEGVFSGGFLLSYSAVISLFYIYPMLKNHIISKTKETYLLTAQSLIIDLALISVSVNIMTIPLLIYLFQGISLVSVFVNILVVPVVMSFYTIGIFSILLSFIYVPLGLFLGGTVEIITNYMIVVIKQVNQFPLIYKYIKTPTITVIIVYYLILYVIVKRYNEAETVTETETETKSEIKAENKTVLLIKDSHKNTQE